MTMRTHDRAANLALAGWSLAPLFISVNPNLNVIQFVNMRQFVSPALLCSAILLPLVHWFLLQGWNDNAIIWRAPYFHSLSVEFTKSQVVASVTGFSICVWCAMKKHWLANNVLGIALSIQSIEMLSLGSFKTGGIVLAGFFVYEVFWVFFTPVMATVAKSFDAPIKLLFPTADAARPLFMLGLGDIILPGRFVALALRFDVSRGVNNRYFCSAFLGYTVGITAAIAAMNWFQAGQPALFYIIPGVTGFVAAHSLWNGEVKPLLEFVESGRGESRRRRRFGRSQAEQKRWTRACFC